MPEQQFSSEITPEKEESFPLKKGVASEMKEIQDRIEQLGVQEKKGTEEGKEKIVKQEIKSYLQELQKNPVLALPVSTRDEKNEIAKFPSNQQAGALVSLAFERGLKKAVSVARSLDNPAILDEFHDMLVDRCYEELLKKGILKL